MPILCYVCHKDKATHRFRTDERRLSLWMNNLRLFERPPDYVRICKDHFVSSDFYTDKLGRKLLSSDASPTLYVKCKSFVSDHNYALGSESDVEFHPPEVFIFLTLSLLFFFDFLLSTPSNTSPPRTFVTESKGDVLRNIILYLLYVR